MSFGGYANAGEIPVVRDAMERLITKHPTAVFCCAAGNKADLHNDPASATKPVFPAGFGDASYGPLAAHVVSVGALDSATGSIAAFSGRGPWVKAWTWGAGVASEYVAGDWTTAGFPPESFVGSTIPLVEPKAIWSGTSFATPRVAACVAEL